MTKQDAFTILSTILSILSRDSESPWIVIENATIQTRFGWIMFFNSKAYLEDGDELQALGGNGPVIVDRNSGTVLFLDSARFSEQLAEYEMKRGYPTSNALAHL